MEDALDINEPTTSRLDCSSVDNDDDDNDDEEDGLNNNGPTIENALHIDNDWNSIKNENKNFFAIIITFPIMVIPYQFTRNCVIKKIYHRRLSDVRVELSVKHVA
jgi:hypothetical protein